MSEGAFAFNNGAEVFVFYSLGIVSFISVFGFLFYFLKCFNLVKLFKFEYGNYETISKYVKTDIPRGIKIKLLLFLFMPFFYVFLLSVIEFFVDQTK